MNHSFPLDMRSIADQIQKTKPISPLHGRSITILADNNKWLSFKGIGWTWAKAKFLISKKDSRLIFGLYDKLNADREMKVSSWLKDNNILSGNTVSCFPLSTFSSFPHWEWVNQTNNIQYNDGSIIEPYILVTEHVCPIRVADLFFFAEKERERWIDLVCANMNWERNSYLDNFSNFVGLQLARLHLAGATNDTLTWDNITLAGELTDFEWIYVPGISTMCGSNDLNLTNRQWKSCIDMFEILDRLGFIFDPVARGRVVETCIASYEYHGGPIPIRYDW
jgi:hypothetical protein